jgi:hypothetical protein
MKINDKFYDEDHMALSITKKMSFKENI